MLYLDNIVNELKKYSGLEIEISNNYHIPFPGLSSLQKINNKTIRLIELNPKMIPEDKNIIAHIMAHEFGHHYLEHVLDDPNTLSKTEMDLREDEADTYASVFIDYKQYDKEPIKRFLLDINVNSVERIKILNNTL